MKSPLHHIARRFYTGFVNHLGHRDLGSVRKSYIKSHTCVTYFAGILTGIIQVLWQADDAEYRASKELGIPRATISAEIDENHDLHSKVTAIYESS